MSLQLRAPRIWADPECSFAQYNSEAKYAHSLRGPICKRTGNFHLFSLTYHAKDWRQTQNTYGAPAKTRTAKDTEIVVSLPSLISREGKQALTLFVQGEGILKTSKSCIPTLLAGVTRSDLPLRKASTGSERPGGRGLASERIDVCIVGFNVLLNIIYLLILAVLGPHCCASCLWLR